MSATSAWTREEILACRFFGDDRTKTLALLEERDAFLAGLKLAEAAQANAEAQRDAACTEAVALREALIYESSGDCNSIGCNHAVCAALRAHSTAEQLLRERDLRVIAETDATTAAFIRGERSVTGSAVANALRERDERVRAAALEEAQDAVNVAVRDVCEREVKAVSKGSAPYTTEFRQAVLRGEVEEAIAALAKVHPPGLNLGEDYVHPGSGRLLNASPVMPRAADVCERCGRCTGKAAR